MKTGDRVTWTSLPDVLGQITTGFGTIKKVVDHQALVVLDTSPREHLIALMDLHEVAVFFWNGGR